MIAAVIQFSRPHCDRDDNTNTTDCQSVFFKI